ncbi:MAG TPA: protein TolR [Chlorobaculum sp.]|jgi:biopolymer transport protein TolR|uniref:ExbD/TolR family protein n=1 Tax=Chlorobaculum tepidum (strain ATCC 49652 / DSM 12025 / NBRC 103806 / TLS) TaxID=194439 RepID=Q8KEQ2_CHLTE|nr:ExbD/TolR family protein [Chlorobaculum tepidum TLS]HBU22841.1 protein TolR [Chlorobaculum sp.]
MMTGQKTRLMSEINVTPFVDVMLVLLVIFMVTAPMMTSGMKVDVPQTTHERMDIDPKGLVVSVDASRKIMINNYQLDESQISERLPKILESMKAEEVYLKADKTLPYGFVMSVMAAIRDAGVEKVGMVTEPLVTDSQKR